MIKKAFVITGASLLLAGLCSSCVIKSVAETQGDFVVKNINIGDFSQLEMDDIIDVKYTTGAPSMTIRARQKVIDNLIIRREDNKVIIGMKPDEGVHLFQGKIEVTVSCSSPKLEYLELNGTGDIDLAGIQSDKLLIMCNGVGDIDWTGGNVNTMSMVVSGLGDIDLQNVKAGDAFFTINGTGDISAEDFAAEMVKGEINGTGDIELERASIGTIDMLISGTGDIKIQGDVKGGKASVEGSGDIRLDIPDKSAVKIFKN